MLLTDLRPISADFEVQKLSAEEVGDKNNFDWVRLIPKVQDTEFYLIELGMDQHGVRQMILHDHFAQRTIVQFEQVDWNAQLSDSVFQFQPPTGVDVIGEPR